MAGLVTEAVWGFAPNRQIKPVHFANRFVRALCGQEETYPLIQKVAGGFRGGTSRTTTEALMTDLHGYYERDDDLADTTAQDRMDDIRTALDLVLNQDRALFGTGSYISPTLTHRKHSTKDPSDVGTGAFMASMLAASGSAHTMDVLRRALEHETDNIYQLTAPLLQKRDKADILVADDLGPMPIAGDDMRCRVQRSSILPAVQRAFDTLAGYASELEKTTFLQHVVLLGSFGLLLHVINSIPREGEADTPIVPILLCAPYPSAVIQEASRATFVRARQQMERAFEVGLAAEMRKSNEDHLSPDDYRALMRDALPNLGGDGTAAKKEKQAWTRFSQDFDAYLLGSEPPFDAFCRAAAQASFVVIGGSPDEFAQFIGRLVGLLYPRQQGRGDKYYLPAPQFLDMLVFALVEPGKEISLEEFWARAAARFGVLCGARGRADIDDLSRWGVRKVSPSHLAQNSRAILEELIRMGHAHEYADDIAMVRGGGMGDD